LLERELSRERGGINRSLPPKPVKYWGETMTEHAKGLLTALDLAVGQRGVDGAAGIDDVPDLFDNDDAVLPLKSKARSGPQGGRPAGSRNRRTEEWVQHLLSRYRSPLVGLLEIYSRPVGELCGILDCDPLEAFKVQQAAMIAALPYIHQKQPMAVNVSSKSAGLIMIGSFDADDGSDAPLMTLSQPEQYQGVSDVEPVKSDGDKSDAQPNLLDSHNKPDRTQ
jgi:hypothetical protein